MKATGRSSSRGVSGQQENRTGPPAMNEADTIEERLVRLERGIKRSERAATATMVLLVSLIAWSVAARSGKAQAAGSGAGDLVARSLTIVDEMGNRRVFLVVGKDGPLVALLDEKGRPRISLKVTKDGPGVFLTARRETGARRQGVCHLKASVPAQRRSTAPSSLTLDKEDNVIWKAP
jgi:hypothetical protein